MNAGRERAIAFVAGGAAAAGTDRAVLTRDGGGEELHVVHLAVVRDVDFVEQMACMDR